MKFLLFNLTAYGDSILETTLDNCFKEIPYGNKIRIKNQKIDYMYILAKINNDVSLDDSESFILDRQVLERFLSTDASADVVRTIYGIIKPVLNLKNIKLSIDIISDSVDGDELDIFYTDGSFKKNEIKSSYACCKLLSEGTEVLHDNFLDKDTPYKSFSGTIDDSTNNIGELTGIKTASENFGSKQYQLIISDSEYSIKAFREWYYTWKDNGFKTYSKKPIKNETLIKETYQKLFSQNKIVLLKWTKGHDDDPFNEKCDELAKKELGIEDSSKPSERCKL